MSIYICNNIYIHTYIHTYIYTYIHIYIYNEYTLDLRDLGTSCNAFDCLCMSMRGIRQHTSAYVSIRQHRTEAEAEALHQLQRP